MKLNFILIASVILFAGMVCSAFVLGRSIERFRKEDRLITVKGFSEKEVKADLVIWSIQVRVTCDVLKEGSNSLEIAKAKVTDFLSSNQIKNEEIIQRDLIVTDRQAVEYVPANAGNSQRYVIEQTLEVRSSNVDLVQKVSRMTDKLLEAGVALSTKSDWRGAGLQFIFTRLNEIKPSMLAEATRNAEVAARQFTEESGTALGKMHRASQGLFSVQDRDDAFVAQSEGGGYGGGLNSDIIKKVKVVITVDYSID